MADKQKTRPMNNFHCFSGVGLGYWFSIARGLKPETVQGPDGTRLEYGRDKADGLALNTGGIALPVQTRIERSKLYFRFYSTGAARKYGNDGWWGNWWVDQDGFSQLRSEAVESGKPLSKVVAQRLALPREWSDVGYVVCATPNVDLQAWAGKGKLAHPDSSPALKQKDGKTYGDAHHMAMRQLFIPGTVPEIGRYFTRLATTRLSDTRAVAFNFSDSPEDVKWPGTK